MSDDENSNLPVPEFYEPEDAPPEDALWSNDAIREVVPGGRILSPRQRELARLFALGKKTHEVAELLNITVAWCSAVKALPEVRDEIDRLQNLILDKTVSEHIKDCGSLAADVIEATLRSTDHAQVKPQLKVETAKWVLEKLTGKPRQEIDVGEQTLGSFFTMLDDMRRAGQVIDVTPGYRPPREAGVESSEVTSDRKQTALPDTAPAPDSDPTKPDFRKWADENT